MAGEARIGVPAASGHVSAEYSDTDDSSTSGFVDSKHPDDGTLDTRNGIRGTPSVSSRFSSKLPHSC